MGLDIAAYRQIRLVGTEPDIESYEDKYDWKKTDYIHPGINGPEFHEHIGDLVAGGVYAYAETMNFRAGSYSGYNQWRDELARYMLGVSAKEVWKSPDKYKHLPFYYLINFSDCEGVISGPVAEKLYHDFTEAQGRADQHKDSWWRELYAKWRQAFEFANDDGYVDFH